MDEHEELLSRTGSVESAAIQIGEQAASEAMYRLTMRAPDELRGSWPMVIAWSRMQSAYEAALDMGDAKTMAQVAKMQSTMLTDLHS